MTTKKEALEDLVWLQEQLESEQDYDDRGPSAMSSNVAKRILKRIKPAIAVLQEARE